MAKFKIVKPCFFGGRFYEAGSVVDFGDTPAPKNSVEVKSIIEKAKAATTSKVDADQEDAVLKGTAK